MDIIFPIFSITVILILSYVIYQKILANKRSTFIAAYKFPETIKNKVNQIYPHLDNSQVEQVIRGLRDYFHLISLSNRKIVAMPSQVVDVAWHEFILFTREYSKFCSKALGRFLHHTPAEAMESKDVAQSGIKRAWRISCHREKINPHAPKRLPKIFGIDARLNIEDGFHYELDCMKLPSAKLRGNANGRYCGSHVGCSSGCAGSSGDGGCSGGGSGCGGD